MSNNSGSQKTNNDSENTTQPLNVTNNSTDNNSIYNTISSTSQLTGGSNTTNNNNANNVVSISSSGNINNNNNNKSNVITVDDVVPKEKRSKDRDRDRNMFTLPAQKDGIFGTLKKHAKRFSSQSFSEGKCDPNRHRINRPKRDKYNRAYYSMNETIEVLGDQVVEDEILVSRTFFRCFFIKLNSVSRFGEVG